MRSIERIRNLREPLGLGAAYSPVATVGCGCGSASRASVSPSVRSARISPSAGTRSRVQGRVDVQARLIQAKLVQAQVRGVVQAQAIVDVWVGAWVSA